MFLAFTESQIFELFLIMLENMHQHLDLHNQLKCMPIKALLIIIIIWKVNTDKTLYYFVVSNYNLITYNNKKSK